MTTYRMEELMPAIEAAFVVDNSWLWPWTVVGVFPVEQDQRLYDWFCYTSGLGPVEMVAPCMSIEDRAAGNELTADVLNTLAGALQLGLIAPGDDVVVSLGVKGGPDIDTVWWIARQPAPARAHEVNMTAAQLCLPVKWSSGLGWSE